MPYPGFRPKDLRHLIGALFARNHLCPSSGEIQILGGPRAWLPQEIQDRTLKYWAASGGGHLPLLVRPGAPPCIKLQSNGAGLPHRMQN